MEKVYAKKEKGEFNVKAAVMKCRSFAAMEEIAESSFNVDTSDDEWRKMKLSEQKKTLLGMLKK